MSLTKEQREELCCVYAGLLLWDDGIEITSEKLAKVIQASGNTVEPYYPEFFAKYLAEADIGSMLTNIGGSGPAAQGASPAAAEDKADDKKDKKDKKKKEEEEEDEDMGGGFDDLFG